MAVHICMDNSDCQSSFALASFWGNPGGGPGGTGRLALGELSDHTSPSNSYLLKVRTPKASLVGKNILFLSGASARVQAFRCGSPETPIKLDYPSATPTRKYNPCKLAFQNVWFKSAFQIGSSKRHSNLGTSNMHINRAFQSCISSSSFKLVLVFLFFFFLLLVLFSLFFIVLCTVRICIPSLYLNCVF